MNQTGGDYKILYVEDDDEDYELFVGAIEASNLPITLHHAKDENKLNDYLKKGMVPDVLLLDVHLPFFNLIDFLQQWKQRNKVHQIPLVIYSSYPLHRYFQKCIDAGATSFLVKPNSFEKWVNVVSNLYSKNYSSNFSVNDRYNFSFKSDSTMNDSL